MYVSGRFPNEKLKSLEDEGMSQQIFPFFRLFWIAYITYSHASTHQSQFLLSFGTY